MDTPRPPVPDTATIRAIAVAADADPRTVRRVIAGGHARGMVDHRIRRACAW